MLGVKTEDFMGLGWINPEEYSFNSFLLMERFQIRLMMESGGWRNNKDEWKRTMGVALNANPAVRWYLEHKCPECASVVQEITANAPAVTNAAEIRKAEVYALASVEDFVIHTTPKMMETNCHYIRDWDKERLYEMADFKDKIVLDVGAGSGRLTFAAAVLAREVYASEPVETMREFIRSKSRLGNINNIRVTEALVTSIPYPDNSFDIVMSGHVVGDDWDTEIAELTRVCKSGGWLLDCPGDETHAPYYKQQEKTDKPDELVIRGWEKMSYVGNGGGYVGRYRKQIWKG
ncbi:MAG: class I SAM-dependent methyltransferase [Oscillospiraceae bacterium]|jgi:phage FluMu protein Com|nr:class I SAM-dependent methyltransferase [Oscillospiraceae bacterium]